ncbi:MAG: hypothetical protein KAY32_04830 [Candidatus Eisenbacteria sp.]|nr:hypothetical protein [Candidatus Eisenbacteria bacterium]
MWLHVEALQKRIDEQGYKWQAGITSVSHLTAPQFQALLGARPPADEPQPPTRLAVGSPSEGDDLPAGWDWKEQGAVTPARAQGECGSCWAFAAAGALEARLSIYDHRITDLSEQHAIDCNPDSYGCDGGWMTSAYRLWRDVGAVAEGDAPYAAEDARPCPGDEFPILATVRDWVSIPASREALKRAILGGPVAVAMHVYADFQYYRSGVYEHAGSDPINHAVLLIGWDDARAAWIIKNSWGTGWGKAGCAYVHYDCCRLGTYAHRIAIPAGDPLVFRHVPLTDTLLTTPATLAAVLISGDAPIDPDEVAFWIDTGEGFGRQIPQRLGGDDFQGCYAHELPALEAGARIRYWLEAADVSGNRATFPSGGSEEPVTFRILRRVFDDSLEIRGVWAVDVDEEGPAAGAWAWGVPEAVFGSAARIIQPGADHSPNGSHCFATGLAAGEDQHSGDVDGGATVLQSPPLDLGGLDDATLRFWLWFANHTGSHPGEDAFVVRGSDDGGQTWVELYRTVEGMNAWRRVDVALEAGLTLTSELLLRFIAADSLGDSVVEALIDDLEILTATKASTSVDGPPPAPLPAHLHLRVGPNPAQAEARVALAVPAGGRVHAAIYDVGGRRIQLLFDGTLAAGDHEWLWRGRDSAGRLAPTGVYWVRVAAGNQTISKRLTLIR